MQYGVCGGAERAAQAARAGYEYVESSARGLLKPREEHEAFAAALRELRSAGLPCPALNLFVPGDLKITGPEADLQALEAYVTRRGWKSSCLARAAHGRSQRGSTGMRRTTSSLPSVVCSLPSRRSTESPSSSNR